MTKKIVLYFIIDIIYYIFLGLIKTKIINLDDAYMFVNILTCIKYILQDIILILLIFDIKAFILKIGLLDKFFEESLKD